MTSDGAYDFLNVVFNNIWFNLAPLPDINLQNLSDFDFSFKITQG